MTVDEENSLLDATYENPNILVVFISSWACFLRWLSALYKKRLKLSTQILQVSSIFLSVQVFFIYKFFSFLANTKLCVSLK